MRPDIEVRDALAAMALNDTPDPLWAASALLAAASAVLSDAIGEREAGEAIHAVVRQVVSSHRH